MQIKEFDTVILGGGPAGFAAGMYASRGAVSTAIVDISMLGGQPSNYLELENYPGFSCIGGFELMEKFEEHADKFGIEKFPMQEIESIDLVSSPKVIKTKEFQFNAKTVIIATGAKPMKLGVPGEAEFVGRGVSYCAVCDGAFYKDKVVAVVGGGNSAVEEAMYLTKFARKVTIIHRRNELRAAKSIQEKAFKNPKLDFMWDSVVEELGGDEILSEMTVKNVKTGEITKVTADEDDGMFGLFGFIGTVPNSKIFEGIIDMDERGYIKTDEDMHTNIPGVYAAGDVRIKSLRQVVTAAADGAIAAVQVERSMSDYF